MAKSIRSKIKRKHRAEFRRTIGTVCKMDLSCIHLFSFSYSRDYTSLPQTAHNQTMEIVQSKLNDVVKQGTMSSFDTLADVLDTDGLPTEMMEVTDFKLSSTGASGENKIPMKAGFKKTIKRKHKLRQSRESKGRVQGEKPKPKFFCEF
jgi:hypothetical protein